MIKNKIQFFFVSIYIIAGLVHLIKPQVFEPAIPGFLPEKILIIYLTGILEITIALGIFFDKIKYLALKVSTYYLAILLIVHVYVSYNVIEIFSIKSPALLWLRTFLQLPLIYFSYKEMKKIKNEKTPIILAPI